MAAWSGFTVIESREGWEIDSEPGSSLMAPLFYLLSNETCFGQLWQWHHALIAPSQVMSNNSQRKLERQVRLLCSMSLWDKVGSGWVRNCFLKWSLHSVGFECAALNTRESKGCQMNMQQAIFCLELEMLDRFLWERGEKTCCVSPSSGWKVKRCSGGRRYWTCCLLAPVVSALLLFYSDL